MQKTSCQSYVFIIHNVYIMWTLHLYGNLKNTSEENYVFDLVKILYVLHQTS